MTMRNTHGMRRPMSEINVVPFIDVMLVLLVIFMITTPLLTQGIKIQLPQTKAEALPPDQKEPLIVTVDAEGNYYLNIASKPTQPVTSRVLQNLVASQLKTADQRPVLVRGDKNTNYGKIVEAMALLQQSGAKSVGLITQAGSPEHGAT